MAKYAYINRKFSKSSLTLIEQANSVIEKYQAMGYRMTLRQLYYQLVAADLIPNNLKMYKRLASVLNDGRWAGLVDWDGIEDRNRETVTVSTWDDPKEIMQTVIRAYREDLWKPQDWHIEIMCEKDAVSNIIQPVCREYGVNFTANRGYASASLLYEVSSRIANKIEDGKSVDIIYVGDHDPSGLDMDRDILTRITTLLEGFSIEVERLALTRLQVDRWNLPPNPAKITDSRADAYIAEYGKSSWELDAIPANRLDDLIREKIREYIDFDLWESAKQEQEYNLTKLKELTKSL